MGGAWWIHAAALARRARSTTRSSGVKTSRCAGPSAARCTPWASVAHAGRVAVHCHAVAAQRRPPSPPPNALGTAFATRNGTGDAPRPRERRARVLPEEVGRLSGRAAGGRTVDVDVRPPRGRRPARSARTAVRPGRAPARSCARAAAWPADRAPGSRPRSRAAGCRPRRRAPAPARRRPCAATTGAAGARLTPGLVWPSRPT